MNITLGRAVVAVHTEADIARLCASLRQSLPQLPEGGDRVLNGAHLLPFRDLAAEVAHDDVAVALRIQNAVRHSIHRPMLKVRHAR